jgi:ArsR family transcriptional regulator
MEKVEFDKMQSFDREAEILKVLGHPVRLKIVAGLISQTCNVKKIWECLGLPQATVSQHLALLKNKGIIEGRREGSKSSTMWSPRRPDRSSRPLPGRPC